MSEESRLKFHLMLGLSQALAITMVVLVVVWTSQSLNGYAWDGTAKEFNLHPLCMICGFLLLYGEGALAFRVFNEHDKGFVKIVHASFHILAFGAMVVGVVAVFQFHNANNIPNLYSLHSWCGLCTILLFCLQYVFGFVTFLFPGLQDSYRQTLLPIHRFFGMAILFLIGVSSISGINEKLFFVGNYGALSRGALLGNFLGLITLAFIVVVGFIVYHPAFMRKDNSEERHLLQDFRRVETVAETTDEE